jgi:hypothetical protein
VLFFVGLGMVLLRSEARNSATPAGRLEPSAPAAGPYSVVKVLVPGRGPMVGRLRVQGVVALKLGGSGHLARLEISRSELPG